MIHLKTHLGGVGEFILNWTGWEEDKCKILGVMGGAGKCVDCSTSGVWMRHGKPSVKLYFKCLLLPGNFHSKLFKRWINR